LRQPIPAKPCSVGSASNRGSDKQAVPMSQVATRTLGTGFVRQSCKVDRSESAKMMRPEVRSAPTPSEPNANWGATAGLLHSKSRKFRRHRWVRRRPGGQFEFLDAQAAAKREQADDGFAGHPAVSQQDHRQRLLMRTASANCAVNSDSVVTWFWK
jgi:hypothetical protein